MGIRTRIKSKLKDALNDVRALFHIVNEEAKHPGRPQPHMVARNPLWGGEAGDAPEKTDVSTDKAFTPKEPKAPKSTEQNEEKSIDTKEDDDFWYLRGDDEGWSDPNPGQS